MFNILGLDISTSKVGISVLDSNEKILFCDFIIFKDNTLCEKASIFRKKIVEIYSKYKISDVFLEEPFISFQGGSSAKTVAILHTFSGMCRYIIYDIFGFECRLLSVNSARKSLGIKMLKKMKAADKKKEIADFVVKKYANDIKLEYTKAGNLKAGYDDLCDSIIIAIYGIRIKEG